MRKYIYLCLIIGFLLFKASTAQAAWLWDYTGTLGHQKIGLTTVSPSSGLLSGGAQKIISATYYYRRALKDIPLRVKSRAGSRIVFAAYDKKNNLRETFNLKFVVNNHLDLLQGTWRNAKSGKTREVRLALTQGVSGDADGGRCDLDRHDYKKLEERVRRFYAAVVAGDAKVLKKDFGFKIPSKKGFRHQVSLTVPHHLFCNDEGFMLGNGIVWFDDRGNVEAVHY